MLETESYKLVELLWWATETRPYAPREMGITSTTIDLEERGGQQLSKGSAQMRKPTSILSIRSCTPKYHNGYDLSYGPQYLWHCKSYLVQWTATINRAQMKWTGASFSCHAVSSTLKSTFFPYIPWPKRATRSRIFSDALTSLSVPSIVKTS